MTWVVGMLLGLGLAVLVVGLNYIPPLVVRWLHVRRLRHLSKGRLVLTYDDGPDTDITPRLLELLSREGVRATFYLVGFRALDDPPGCELIRDAGHELGCHTFQHPNYWRLWPWQTVRDVSKAYRTLSRWTGERASFRPAFGKLTTCDMLWLLLTGRRIVWWTEVGGDMAFELEEPRHVAHRLLDTGGSVLLLHSRHRLPERQEYVLELTEALIQTARERGYDLCTVSELLAGDARERT